MKSCGATGLNRLRGQFLPAIAMLACLWTMQAAITTAAAGDAAVEAIKLAINKDYDKAAQLARQSGNAAAIKAVEWFYIRRNPRDSGYFRQMAFVKANPNWPSVRRIEAAAERSLTRPEIPVDVIADHFPHRKPVSAHGWLARARYALEKGDRKTAYARLMNAWLDPDLNKNNEQLVLKKFGSLLSKRDHTARMWRLILDQKTTAAVRVAKRISKAHVNAAQTARNLIKVAKGADGAYRKLPKSFRNSVAMRYALARYYRKKKKKTAALKMLLALPKDTRKHINHEQWWIEKRLIIRHLLGPNNGKHWPNAYRLAQSHGFASGKHHSEGEFLAGWIALRKLNQAPIALSHFQRMAKGAESRTQRSRAYYWIARSYLALGNPGAADQAFRKAAASPTLYYGQLSREALGLGRKPIPIRAARITSAARRAARNNELVRVYQLLVRANAKRFYNLFLWPMAGEFKTAAELSAVAEIVRKNGGLSSSVRFAKMAGARGVDIDDWGYPAQGSAALEDHWQACGTGAGLWTCPPGERVPSDRQEPCRCPWADADHAGDRQADRTAVQVATFHEQADGRPEVQRHAGRCPSRRPDTQVSRVLHPDLCRLQRGSGPFS